MFKTAALVLSFLLSAGTADAMELELLADGLGSPIEFVQPDPSSGRFLVAEQTGLVHLYEGGKRRQTPFLDLRPRMMALQRDFEERGLIGFALHPDFASNGRFYVHYSAPLAADAPAGWDHTQRISEITTRSDMAYTADPGTERVLLSLDWPSRKHNGGALAFGPGGLLYIGIGDGGGAHGVGREVKWSAFEVPPEQLHWDRLAQDTTSLFGSVLRIDVDRGFPGTGIPATNPHLATSGRNEIYAWGVRNPFRIAFDSSGTGDFLITAVGETLWEAVYLVSYPGNLGWPVREGDHCIDRADPRNPPAENTCADQGANGHRMQRPVIEYPNMQVMHPETRYEAKGVGTAITGARIYRGAAFPDLAGKIVFSDWSADFRTPSGQLFVAEPPRRWSSPWPFKKIRQFDTRIVGLAEDADRELIVLTNDDLNPFGVSGKVYRLKP